MFSSRARWNLTPNRLASLVEARRAAGAPVIDLTQSNPTQAEIPYPGDLLRPLSDPSALRYDPSPLGLRAAREAVAADYRRRGAEVPADHILLTAGSSEAYGFLLKLLCDPGDEVLVPRPSYPLFEYLAGLESVAVRPYPLHYDGEWHLDPADLADAATSRTRAIVVVNPNNPTGSFLKRDEALRIHDIAAERRAALVSDEVFADYAWGRPDPRRLGCLVGDGPALAFSLGGISKSCGLPQLKLGWIAASGPRSLLAEALARLEVVADTYLSVGTPVQQALPGLLGRLPELQAPIAARLSGNLELLRRAVGPAPVTLLEPEGGWYAPLRIPATSTEEDRVARLLQEDGVLVHPGYFFDFPREAYLVVSLLPPPAQFREGIDRILSRML